MQIIKVTIDEFSFMWQKGSCNMQVKHNDEAFVAPSPHDCSNFYDYCEGWVESYRYYDRVNTKGWTAK